MNGWIRGNTKIGPALEGSHHQGRYGIEIIIESLFGDGTCSWVMIVNGINKYITEMTEETQENHIGDIGDSTGKLVVKARPKQTSMPPTSSPTVTSPYHLGEWIDIEPGKCCKKQFRSVKKDDQIASTRFSVLREEDGAVEIRIWAPMFRSEFTSSQYCSIRTWLNYLQKRRRS